MEAAQNKSVRNPLPVTDAFMQTIAFRAILASWEYPNNMREWQNLTPVNQKWDKWKTKFFHAYASKELINNSIEAVGQPFGGQDIAQALPHQVQPQG